MKKNTVALVPLRGGSKSIPLKNIKIMAGKPLCAWVLEAACDAVGPSNVYVSTDSKEIVDVINNLRMGVHIIKRPPELASDTSSTESVMLHFAESVEFDTLITLQATSPLTTSEDVQKALNLFTSNDYDSLVTGVRCKRFFWTLNGNAVNYDPRNRPLRQDIEGWIMENGAFYITKYEILQRDKCRVGGNIGIYEMAPETVIEIDEPEDWPEVERRLRRSGKSEAKKLIKDIKLLAVDVDGTLTDAGMYYSSGGEELKKFNTRDAQGMALLREKGIKLAIITRGNSPIATARSLKLGIKECHIGIQDKLACLKGICQDMGIKLSNVAYAGDDVSDIECIKHSGFSACPADAAEVIKSNVHYISSHPGGQGAVREICDFILRDRQDV